MMCHRAVNKCLHGNSIARENSKNGQHFFFLLYESWRFYCSSALSPKGVYCGALLIDTCLASFFQILADKSTVLLWPGNIGKLLSKISNKYSREFLEKPQFECKPEILRETQLTLSLNAALHITTEGTSETCGNYLFQTAPSFAVCTVVFLALRMATAIIGWIVMWEHTLSLASLRLSASAPVFLCESLRSIVVAYLAHVSPIFNILSVCSECYTNDTESFYNTESGLKFVVLLFFIFFLL